MLVRFPDIIRPFFGNVIWRKKNPSSKVIYLTFDDGPVPEVTERVLEILDYYDCKATFFCVGDNVRRYPELYSEILLRGHITGNHTFSHLNGWHTNLKNYILDIENAKKYIRSKFFRPPYGRMTRGQLKRIKLEFDVVYWDILSGDYEENKSSDRIVKNVMRNVRNGSVVVFHDSIKARKNVLEALPECILRLKKEGYNFQTL